MIDGGNSYYRDDIERARQCRAKGLHYVDCGTSGGVFGLDRGYCLMIGGEDEAVAAAGPDLATIAPGEGSAAPTPGRTRTGGTAPHGYLHCGPNGAGHFVKMVHNGIEYGMMAAIAEGLSIIKHADAGKHQGEVDAETTPLRDPWAYQYDIDVAEVAEVWRRGSVVGSWLVDLTADALARSPELDDFSGRVSGFRRGPLDAPGGDRHRRARRGDRLRPVRAAGLARQRRVRRQDPLRDAVRVRRSRREEELAGGARAGQPPRCRRCRRARRGVRGQPRPRRGSGTRDLHFCRQRRSYAVGDVRRAGGRRCAVAAGAAVPGRRAGGPG